MANIPPFGTKYVYSILIQHNVYIIADFFQCRICLLQILNSLVDKQLHLGIL